MTLKMLEKINIGEKELKNDDFSLAFSVFCA